MIDSLPKGCEQCLKKGVDELRLDVTDEQVALLLHYVALLSKWNKAFNLTAVRDPNEMIVRHILDSLSVVRELRGENIADVGTGPGIPGVPLAIIFPKRQFTLVDSNGKKVRFINQAKQSLNLKNVTPVQCRVEEFNSKERFDSVISRAFTSLGQMVELTEHLVIDGGVVQAMKGAYPEQQNLKTPWVIEDSIKLTVPFLDEQRHLVNIKRKAT